MMRAKLLLTIAAVLIAAFSQLRAIPEVETLTVETLVNLSKTGIGEAGGALFLPDGNIIALWKSIPHIIDGKTGEILRRLDTVHSSTVNNPKLSKDGNKLVAISMGPKLKVWDVPSGKLIFEPEKEISYFCLSPDGTRLYVTLPNNADNPGLIAIYDMADFQEIERLSYAGLNWAGQIDISPDGQTLALSAGKEKSDPYDKKTNPAVLINLNDKKKYTIVDNLESGIKSMEFSPDGKQIAFRHNSGDTGEMLIYIYDIQTKQKLFITMKELSTLFGFQIVAIGDPFFIDGNTILFSIRDLPFEKYYFIDWNIDEHRTKYFIGYPSIGSVDIRDSTVLFCNQHGLLAFLNKNVVSVNNNGMVIENQLTFNNNQLVYYSDKAFVGESVVYDISGKMIMNLGTQVFVAGKNIIRLNQPLQVGVYFLTLTDDGNPTSYKFMVE